MHSEVSTPDRDDKFLSNGKAPRTVYEAIDELQDLLASEVEEVRAKILSVVTEIEGFYARLDRNFGTASQNEGDAGGTMYMIRQALSDTRLKAMGIVSDLAFGEKGA